MTPLPLGWAMRPLGDLVDILDGRRIPVSATERGGRPGSIPYFGAAGQVGWIDRPIFDEELVLLGEDGVQFFDPIRPKAYRISGPAWVNNHAHVLRARPAMDWKYLEHFLNWFDYRGFANGTTRLKLTQAAMRRIEVRLPSLPEQRRIVGILEDHLSRLDAAEEYLRASSRRQRTLRAAALTGLARCEASLATMSELAVSGGYGTSTRCAVDGRGVPVARIPNLRHGMIDLTDEKRVVDETVDLSGLMLEPGDVLIVRTNGSRGIIGTSAVVQRGVYASFASYLIRYRVDRSRVFPEWVHLMLERPEARNTIESLAASSAGQYNLSLSKLDGIEIPLPSLDQQRARLADYWTFADGQATMEQALDRARRRSSSLRRALLAAAFSGRLTGRSSDLDRAEEMASA